MPFVDDDQLATLYKEVEQEKKAAAYFQKLYQKDKQALKLLKLYRYGSVLLLFVLFVVGGYIFWSQQARETSNEMSGLLERIEQLELENEILGSGSYNIQERLKKEKVFTVQFMASSNKEIMLFSEHFVNFRGHPMEEYNAYSLGNFSSEKEAEVFRQELIALGLSDVWVTSYQNGKRILIDRNE